jgi:hypothetical protein
LIEVELFECFVVVSVRVVLASVQRLVVTIAYLVNEQLEVPKELHRLLAAPSASASEPLFTCALFTL